jgi:hypothetical protein
VIEFVGVLGLNFGPNITWSEITPESTDEPITTGIAPKLVVAPELFRMSMALVAVTARQQFKPG